MSVKQITFTTIPIFNLNKYAPRLDFVPPANLISAFFFLGLDVNRL